MCVHASYFPSLVQYFWFFFSVRFLFLLFLIMWLKITFQKRIIRYHIKLYLNIFSKFHKILNIWCAWPWKEIFNLIWNPLSDVRFVFSQWIQITDCVSILVVLFVSFVLSLSRNNRLKNKCFYQSKRNYIIKSTEWRRRNKKSTHKKPKQMFMHLLITPFTAWHRAAVYGIVILANKWKVN